MVLDYIDDRDTFISQTLTLEQMDTLEKKFKVWQTAIKNELPPDAMVTNLSDGRFKIDLATITCTGAQVKNIFNIPFMHQLLKVEIKHTYSANADSANPLDYSLSHRHHPNLWMLVLDVSASVASDIIDEYQEYFMSRGEYKFLTDSTNTELLHISVYIKIVGE